MNNSVRVEAKEANNLFAFYFGMKEDKQHVYLGRPWVFNKQFIVLVKLHGVGDVSLMNFSLVSFCLQIHNMPLACENKEYARFWGKLIGIVEEVDLEGPIMCV